MMCDLHLNHEAGSNPSNSPNYAVFPSRQTHHSFAFSALRLLAGHLACKKCRHSMFLTHHDSMVAGTLLLSQGECSLDDSGKEAHAIITFPTDLSWQHGGNVLSPVRNTVIIQCFDAVGWVTGRASGL